MPGTTSLAIAAIGLGAAGLGYSVYQGEQTRKAQSTAQDQAKDAALKQEQSALKAEKQADEANNAANRKTPDVGAILSAAQQAAKGGVGGTMLTGPTGISPDQLQLGKTSLLG